MIRVTDHILWINIFENRFILYCFIDVYKYIHIYCIYLLEQSFDWFVIIIFSLPYATPWNKGLMIIIIHSVGKLLFKMDIKNFLSSLGQTN